MSTFSLALTRWRYITCLARLIDPESGNLICLFNLSPCRSGYVARILSPVLSLGVPRIRVKSFPSLTSHLIVYVSVELQAAAGVT